MLNLDCHSYTDVHIGLSFLKNRVSTTPSILQLGKAYQLFGRRQVTPSHDLGATFWSYATLTLTDARFKLRASAPTPSIVLSFV